MTTKYKKYPEYKDSGVEWIGKIPSSWDSLQFRRVTHLQQGLQIAQSERFSEPQDDLIEYITIKSINAGRDRGHKEYILNPSSRVQCDINDVLLARTGATGEVVTDIKGVFHNNFFKVNYDKRKIVKDYLVYLLSVKELKNHLLMLAGTTTIPDLNHGSFLGTYIPSLSMQEQEQIVHFLDYETSIIDSLIEKQERLIELLKEKRQAVISHAVTKGLNPDSPMKDSGVEWLGKVPEHWGKSQLGFEATIKARLGWKGLKAEEYVNEGYIFLATPNIKGKKIDFENVNYITKKRYEESPEIMLKVGDVLVTKDGSTTGTVNIVRSLPKEATVNSSIAVIRPMATLNSTYLYYYFTSTYIQEHINLMRGGMGVPHLFQADLKCFIQLLPPISEQVEIGTYLDVKLAKIDKVIDKAVIQIAILKERRTTLISAVVTGKIDVREWVKPG